MNVELTGRISKMGELQTIKEGLTKIDFEIDVTENNYTNTFPVQAMNEKAQYVEAYKVGDVVKVSCNLVPSKPFKSKTGKEMRFLNLNVWFIKALDETANATQKSSMETFDPNDEFPDLPSVSASANDDDESLDLPF